MTTEEIVTIDDDEPKVPDFNVFVGSETGLLKGISVNPKMSLSKNFLNMQHLERKHEITAMAWGDEDESEILLGLRGNIVRSFHPEDKLFASTMESDANCGKIVGIARAEDAIVTACESGVVKVWRNSKSTVNVIDYDLSCSGKLKAGDFKDEEAKEKHLVSMKIERALHRMRQVPKNSNLVVTGGKENDLQLWDVSNLEKGPLFRAKNVPHDKLELRVPIWVTDMCFPDNTTADKIAITSRYGHIRLYDTKGSQRRPVLNLEWPEEILTAVTSTSNANEIIVGSSTGFIAQYDLRMSHKGLKRKYRGCTGGIRSLDCHKTHGYFTAVGLDRFLRVFDINQPKPVHKMYLKSRLNHVLLSKEFSPDSIPKPEEKKKKLVKKTVKEEEPKKMEDGEEFWKKIPVIRSTDTKKSKKIKKRGYVENNTEESKVNSKKKSRN